MVVISLRTRKVRTQIHLQPGWVMLSDPSPGAYAREKDTNAHSEPVGSTTGEPVGSTVSSSFHDSLIPETTKVAGNRRMGKLCFQYCSARKYKSVGESH